MLPNIKGARPSQLFRKLVLPALLLPAVLAQADDPRISDLADVWKAAKENIYPPTLSAQFEPEVYEGLLAQLHENPNKSVADVINPFLTSLGISHTYLYDEHNLGYYLFRSMFTTRDINSPKVVHVGAQTSFHAQGLLIDAVLDGGPADIAGIKRGDVLTTVNGTKPVKDSAFFAYKGQAVEVTVSGRTGVERTVTVKPIEQSIHAALAQATNESVRIIERDGTKIGYIHLWAGTDQQFLDILTKAVSETFSEVDGIVLDLRDGYGGAWWPYLDPFFPNTSGYFVAKRIDRDGSSELMEPEMATHEEYYAGPLIVLTNGGIRSGKEALAYQFKKSDRATLIGSTTAGAFVGGYGGFADQERGFILYLSVYGMMLDENSIEGKGITPHIEVPPYDSEYDDLPLERGLQELVRQAG